MFRAFLVDGSTRPGVESVKKNLRIYPLADVANPPPMKFVNASGVPANFVAPGDYSFWTLLNQVIQEEPAEGSDPTTLGLFASIGIVKGQPFNPDERMKKILTDAANIGAVTARTIAFKIRSDGGVFLSRQCVAPALLRRLQVRGGARCQQSGRRRLLLLLRDRRHACDGGEDGGPGIAIPVVGAGCQGQSLRWRQDLQAAPAAEHPGQGFLVGHRLRQPDPLNGADRPEAPSVSSQNKGVKINADGSVDVYFGPKAPAGMENNWVQTIPGKGWFMILRLYGPLEPWFNKTWRPGEIELQP